MTPQEAFALLRLIAQLAMAMQQPAPAPPPEPEPAAEERR